MARVAIVRNFTVGTDADNQTVAWFDAYYDDGESVPVTLTTTQIVEFVQAAKLLDAARVDGVACLLDDSQGHPPTYMQLADF